MTGLLLNKKERESPGLKCAASHNFGQAGTSATPELFQISQGRVNRWLKVPEQESDVQKMPT